MPNACAFPECIAQATQGGLCPVHQPEAIRQRLEDIVLNNFGPVIARYTSRPGFIRELVQLRQDIIFDLANTL